MRPARGLLLGVLIALSPLTGDGLWAATRMLVLDAQVGENVEPPAAGALLRRFRARLRSSGLVNFTTARTTSAAAPAAECGNLECAVVLARRLKFSKVMLARIEKPGRDYVAEIMLIDAVRGAVEARVGERLPSLEPEDRERGSESLARRMEAEMRKLGYRPPRRLTRAERWLRVFPGVGQYYRGQYVRSGIFISAGFLAFRNFLETRREHRLARNEFHDTGVPAAIALGLRNEPQLSVTVNALYGSRLRANLDARAREGNMALLILGGLLAWNFLDAENDYEYFSARRPYIRTLGLEWRPFADPVKSGRAGRLRIMLRVAF